MPCKRGKKAFAKLRTKKKPQRSVTVVNTGPEANAASTLKKRKTRGIIPPRRTDNSVFSARAAPTTNPRMILPFHNHAIVPRAEPSIMPLSKPSPTSLLTTRAMITRSHQAQRQFPNAYSNSLIARTSTHIRNNGQENRQSDDGLKCLLKQGYNTRRCDI